MNNIMRHLFLLLLFLSSLTTNGQNLKKLLSTGEYESVQSYQTVYKTIGKNSSRSFEGFQGTIGILKLGNKLHYFFLGEAKKLGAGGNIIAIMKSDSLGYLLSYFETDPKNGVIFDCVYEYKKINGKLFRLESQKLFYGPNRISEEGQRFLKMTGEGIGNRFSSSSKAYGKWTYYTREGEIEKTKDFGNLE